jgi:urocanate hydratase
LGKFDEQNIHIDLGSTKLLYIILGRRILPVGISFEEEYDDGENPSLFKEKVQETLRKHTINNKTHC